MFKKKKEKEKPITFSMESPKSKTHTILRFFNILIFGDRPKIRKTQINRSIHRIFLL